MSLLVRKISLSKWMQTDIVNGAQPSADAITGCTRTHFNTLSVWSVESEIEVSDAVLAIASNFDKVDKIDVVVLDRDSMEKKGLPVKFAPGTGATIYTEFIQKHHDICNLDYGSLGAVSQEIIDSIRSKRYRQISRGTLKSILAEGIRDRKIRWEDLKEGVRGVIPQDGKISP